MRIRNGFELVNVAEEHLIIPVGDNTNDIQGIVVLNDAAAFLLENLQHDFSTDKAVDLLTCYYNVEHDKASNDVNEMIKSLIKIGVLVD